MKVRVNSKKGLKASLSILVDKKTIQKKLDEKLIELQDKVQLKGFRPGKVPAKVIKNQFGKAVYGEVIDGILKETSTKAIEDNKIKVFRSTLIIKWQKAVCLFTPASQESVRRVLVYVARVCRFDSLLDTMV